MLEYKKVTGAKQIEEVYNYNIDAFSDSPDFKWTLSDIKHEVSDGWDLYAVILKKEIIAAAFCKLKDNTLFTKNTSIKMTFQGHGHSHRVKAFFEKKAIELKVKTIVHYCSIDDFRMYSLNESHGYEKTENKYGELGHVVEWVKGL